MNAGIVGAKSPAELHPEKNIMGVSLMEQDQQNKERVVQHHPDEGNFSLLGPGALGYSSGLYDKPLACFGCGIGWFSFILGFVFPPLWYYATVLYFVNSQIPKGATWPRCICHCCFSLFGHCPDVPACCAI